MDLFAGGCAITHAALESGKYRRVIANDLDPRGIDLFIGAIQGKYRNDYRVISREDFEALKDTDPYVALCWSFGNRARNYLWGEQYEAVKFPACKMLTASTVEERRRWYTRFIKELQGCENMQSIQCLEALQRLEAIQGLEDLQSIEALQRIEALRMPYEAVDIPDGSVVYCDIPYKRTDRYETPLDYDRFLDWAAECEQPCFVSSYEIEDARFECVAEFPKRQLLSSANNSTVKLERLYRPTNQIGGGA